MPKKSTNAEFAKPAGRVIGKIGRSTSPDLGASRKHDVILKVQACRNVTRNEKVCDKNAYMNLKFVQICMTYVFEHFLKRLLKIFTALKTTFIYGVQISGYHSGETFTIFNRTISLPLQNTI